MQMTTAMVIIALVGTILNTLKDWRGFLFWMVSNAALAYHNWKLGEWEQATLWAVYFGISVFGLYQWRIKGVKNKHL